MQGERQAVMASAAFSTSHEAFESQDSYRPPTFHDDDNNDNNDNNDNDYDKNNDDKDDDVSVFSCMRGASG